MKIYSQEYRAMIATLEQVSNAEQGIELNKSIKVDRWERLQAIRCHEADPRNEQHGISNSGV